MTSSSYRNPGSSQTINYQIDSDPSIAPGLAAEANALCFRSDIPSLYAHSGPLDTDWTQVGVGPLASLKSIVVYAPGMINPSAPYYNNWDDVEAAINAVQGACQLWVDQTGIVGYAQVPATCDLDGNGRLEIVGKGPNGEAGLTFADGAQIRNVQTFRTIVLRGSGNTRPPLLWNLDGMICECFDATFLFAVACTQPVMAIVAPVTYISFFFSHSSELRNGNNPGAAVLDIGAGVLCFLPIDTLFFPSSFDGKISGPIGSTLQIQTDASLPVSFVLPAFLGVLTVTNLDSKLGNAGGTISFFGQPAAPRPTVVGSRGGNAALASLLTELQNLGLIIDGTVP